MKKLFGHPDSGHAFKVRFFMSHAGIEHEYQVVDIWQDRKERAKEFQDNAAFGEVPLLLDDGIPYVQSNAILLHLARQSGQWAGETQQQWAMCEQWLVWESNKIGMCLPQIRTFERFDQTVQLASAIPWLKARYEHDVGILESTLADGRQWVLGGDHPSIADFSLCGYLFFADESKVQVPNNVSTWLSNLSQLEGWKHPYELLA